MDDDIALIAALVRARDTVFAPQGVQALETRLGKEFGGTDLSGGQWQRLALARAFMRMSGLLVLDEPTSALDPFTEADFLGALRDATAGSTALIISHRLGVARGVDRILVLHEGRLIEAGTHADLLKTAGVYRDLWESQAQWYM